MNIQTEMMGAAFPSNEVRFYTSEDIMKLTGWGEKAVNMMFRDPEFPSVDFGKHKVVEAHALINYFSVRRSKKEGKHWTRGELSNELRKRVG